MFKMQKRNIKRNKKIKSAIISVSYDGVISHYCGVGTIAYNMSLAIDRINKSLNKKYDYFIISTANNKNCLGYSRFLEKNQKQIVKRNGGKILFVRKKTKNQFGNISKWKKETPEICKIISKLAKKYKKIVVFLHDAPFAGIPGACLKNLNNAFFILIPHGTGELHGKNSADKKIRIKWEKENLIDNDQFRIAFISEYMKKHLNKKYNVNYKKLIELKNGLIFNLKNMEKDNTEFVKIPKNKKIVLIYGRSEPYKNINSILKTLPFLNKKAFVLIIASDKTSHNPENIKLKIESMKHANCLVIPKYVSPGKIKRFLEKNCSLVIVPSLKEPFGMIPSEVRIWGRKSNSIVLAANKGGLKEQVKDKKNGFIIKSFKPKEFAEQINQILSLTLKEKKEISKRGYKFVKKNYNYVANLKNLLNRISNS